MALIRDTRFKMYKNFISQKVCVGKRGNRFTVGIAIG